MSDEYQPDEVVDSLPEPDIMPAEPMEVEPIPVVGEAAGEPVVPDSASSEPESDMAAVENDAIIEAPTPLPSDAVTVQMPVAEVAEASAVTEIIMGEVADDLSETEATTQVLEAKVDTETIVVEEVAVDADSGMPEPDFAPVEVPTIISLADLEKPRRERARLRGDEEEKATRPSSGVLASLKSLLAGRLWIVGAVLGALLLLVLFLPPISLARRLGNIGGGYTALDSEMAFLEHPDGLRVSLNGDDGVKAKAKLASIPRADFVAGSVPEELAAAVTALPAYLEVKSPYYTLDIKTKEPVAGTMTVVIPNEAEPWETLDLYAWDGEAWRWLPTRLDRDAEVLVSDVDALPASVMVVQSTEGMRRVAAEADAWPIEGLGVGADEVAVAGLLIGTMGGTTGEADALPLASEGGQVALVPIVRNWLPGREPNQGLVSDMVSEAAYRQAHTANLVNLTQQGGYAGLVVDYRNLQLQDRAAYAGFISELGTACDAAGLQLGVVVDTPQRAADGSWDTGGYDWQRLGAVADQVRIVMPVSSEAYEPGGEAEQLVQWAITQVERHKLMLVYSTLSQGAGQAVGVETVLASVGDMQVTETLTESVLPGTKLNMSLSGGVAMQINPTTGATRVTAGDSEYWLGTPQYLSNRMDLANRYLLGGVVLRDLFDSRNLGDMAPVLAAYKSGDMSAIAGDMSTINDLSSVVWSVTDPAGKMTEVTSNLSQPTFTWTAPAATGTYRLAATIAGVNKGAQDITVAEPAPVVTDTLTAGEAEGEDEEGAEDEEGETEVTDTLSARFGTDVTIPDDTRFEQGEEFVKTWRMVNDGDVDWPENTVMAFASGDELGKEKEVEVGAVKAGDSVDIDVEMQAPNEDGKFKSVWELRADGKAIDGGAAYVQIIVGEEAATPDTPASPQVPTVPVASGSFELGGHIRDPGMPYADKMHYAGMNWAKVQVPYGSGAGIVSEAHARGFKIQLSAIGGASMVTQPGFEDKFASWVAGLAAAGADAIEIWNEPNLDREWKGELISPQAYTNLLCKSYAAIKAANPGTAVISAAPAPTGYFGGYRNANCVNQNDCGYDDKPWMEGLYAAGAANCMDYIGAHHNSGATSPSARIGHPANPGDTHHSWFFLPQTELYYNIFRGTRQIFYTEMGYASQEGVPTISDGWGWARGITNAQQAAWLAEAVQLSINTGMVRCVIVWNIDFARYGADPQDAYAIIRPGGSCPACDALHNILGTR